MAVRQGHTCINREYQGLGFHSVIKRRLNIARCWETAFYIQTFYVIIFHLYLIRIIFCDTVHHMACTLLIYTCLTFADIRYAACVFIIL